MEHLFSTCTRYQDLLGGRLVPRYRGRFGTRSNPERLRELNLNVSTEELLSTKRAFTYADLYAMLGNEETLAWLTPHAAVMRDPGNAADCCYFLLPFKFSLFADGEHIFVATSSSAACLDMYAVLIRLLAGNQVHGVTLCDWGTLNHHAVFSNASPCFAYLMEQCQSLKLLSLYRLFFDENHILALGALSRPNFKINLINCRTAGASAEALVEILKRNHGPAFYMAYCHFHSFMDVLRGDSRLKSLILDSFHNKRSMNEFPSVFRENKSLVRLKFDDSHWVTDDQWGAICDSLETHPSLEVLDLHPEGYTTPAISASRIQALVDMLKVNISIHTIHLDYHHSEHENFRRSVAPYLETNRFRPRLLAIQKARPFPYRVKLLGRALLATRTDPNRLWMLLSGNVDAAFPSTAANLMVRAHQNPLYWLVIAAATLNAAVLPAAVTGASAATGGAANVATLAACRKRKASP
jgi:hypothetical protein